MKINKEILEQLEKTLDTIHPEDGDINIEILGFGEISLVFKIIDDPAGDIAYKRLPIFSNQTQVEKHITAYKRYNDLLENIGLSIPDYGAEWVNMNNKNIALYCAQERVSPESVGNRVIHQIKDEDISTFVILLMREMKKIWDFNLENNTIQLALDGQISNVAIKDYMPGDPIHENMTLVYLDTSTPMYKVDGEHAMEGELFLKSAPPGIRKILKLFFLEEVLERYYDWREVTIDLIANFYKEQKPEVIPLLIQRVNQFFSESASNHDIKPITHKEVEKYYKSDKFIWVLFQNMRRFDRFIRTKILRKSYDFYLPEKINR
ncbi:MAG: hypothetical protein INQ03_16160 [Candidatus Heimdallarchaeota archaeon]|nr:hypothetical protein [Candidatus Heimdallarchaeota archaeon]